MFESRKENSVQRDDALGIPYRKRRGLRGWEFADLVNFKFTSERKEVDINRKTAGDWEVIAAENPDIVVLFCKGLEQPLRPAKIKRVCGSWTPIPEGHCYLTAFVPCLKKLSDEHGGNYDRPKLTNELYWHRPRGSNLFEDCDFDSQTGCSRLQELTVGKKACPPGLLQPQGAAIFGIRKQDIPTRCEPVDASSDEQLHDSTSDHEIIHYSAELDLTFPTTILGPRSIPVKQRQSRSSSADPSRTVDLSVAGPSSRTRVVPPPLCPTVFQPSAEHSVRVRPKHADLRKAHQSSSSTGPHNTVE